MSNPTRQRTSRPSVNAKFAGHFHHPQSPHSHITHFTLDSPVRDRLNRMHTSVYTIEFFPPGDFSARAHHPLYLEVWGDVDDAMEAVRSFISGDEVDITKLPSFIPSLRADQLIPFSRAHMESHKPSDKSAERDQTTIRRRRVPTQKSGFSLHDIVCADTSAGFFIGRIIQILGQHQGVTYYMLEDTLGNVLGTAAETTLRPVARDALGQNTCLPYDLERRKR